jgi:hypothetical protein
MGGFLDLTGMTFGHLVVLKLDPVLHISKSNGFNINHWICRCKCGKLVSQSIGHLRSGAVKQCFECKYKNFPTWKSSSHDMLRRIKDRAKVMGWDFDLDLEYIDRLLMQQKYTCALSGLPIELAPTIKEQRKFCLTTASIDRIDCQKGYIKGNVQWVHKDVNMMKGKLDDSEFIEWCCLVAKHHSMHSEEISNQSPHPLDDSHSVPHRCANEVSMPRIP